MAQRLVPFIDEFGEKHSGIYIDLETDILYYVKKHENKLIKFSLKRKRDQLIAAKRYANSELPRMLGKSKQRKSVPFNDDGLDQFLAKKQTEGLDETTLKRIETTVRIKLRPFWGRRLASEINDDTVIEWLDWYMTNFPGETLDNAVKYLRAYANWLHKQIRFGQPVLLVVPKIKDPNQKQTKSARKKKTDRVLTGDEFKSIYATAENPEQALAALFMFTMASRIDETLNLKFGEQIRLDLSPPQYVWSIGQNKADHEGSHDLHDYANCAAKGA
jgi:integrase